MITKDEIPVLLPGMVLAVQGQNHLSGWRWAGSWEASTEAYAALPETSAIGNDTILILARSAREICHDRNMGRVTYLTKKGVFCSTEFVIRSVMRVIS